MRKYMKTWILITLMLVSLVMVSCSSKITIIKKFESITVEVGDPVDYKKLFTIKNGNKEIEVTDSMIDGSGVNLELSGEYVVTINYKKKSASIKIIVNDKVDISLTDYTREYQEGDLYDYTKLFLLTVNGKNVAITSSMIDVSAVDTSKSGTYPVILNYTIGDVTKSKEVKINFHKEKVVLISQTNVSTSYYLGDTIDYTKLFAISEDNQNIEVTENMIDISKVNPMVEGTYPVTLNYNGYKKEINITIINPLTNLENAISNFPESYSVTISGKQNGLLNINGLDVEISLNNVKKYFTFDLNYYQSYQIYNNGDKWIKDTINDQILDFYLSLFINLDSEWFTFVDNMFIARDEYLNNVMDAIVIEGLNETPNEVKIELLDNQINKVYFEFNDGTVVYQIGTETQIIIPDAELLPLEERLPSLEDGGEVGSVNLNDLEVALNQSFANVTVNAEIMWMDLTNQSGMEILYKYNGNKGFSSSYGLDFTYAWDNLVNGYLVNSKDGYYYANERQLQLGMLGYDLNIINELTTTYLSAGDGYFVPKSNIGTVYRKLFGTFFEGLLCSYMNEDYTISENISYDGFVLKVVDQKITYVAGRLKYKYGESDEYYTVKLTFSDYNTTTFEEVEVEDIYLVDRLVAKLDLDPNYTLNYEVTYNGVKDSMKISYFNGATKYQISDDVFALTVEPIYYNNQIIGYENHLFQLINGFWIRINEDNSESLASLGLPDLYLSYEYQMEDETYRYLSSFFESLNSLEAKTDLNILGNCLISNYLIYGREPIYFDTADYHNITYLMENNVLVGLEIVVGEYTLKLTIGEAEEYRYPSHGQSYDGSLHEVNYEGVGSTNVSDLEVALKQMSNIEIEMALTVKTDALYRRDIYNYVVGENDGLAYQDGDVYYYQYFAKYNTYLLFNQDLSFYNWYSYSELVKYNVILDLDLSRLPLNYFVMENDYFTPIPEIKLSLLTALFGDFTASGNYDVTIDQFMFKVVNEFGTNVLYIGAKVTRTNGYVTEEYIAELTYKHGNVDLSTERVLAELFIESNPLEPALIKLGQYRFKTEYLVNNGIRQEKTIVEFYDNLIKYIFEDGRIIYAELSNDKPTNIYLFDEVLNEWYVEQCIYLSEYGLPELYYINYFYPNESSNAYVSEFAENVGGNYVISEDYSWFFAFYLIYDYLVFDQQVIELDYNNYGNLTYKLDNNGLINEIIIINGEYTITWIISDGEAIDLPIIGKEPPAIIDDNLDDGSNDINDLEVALLDEFNNYHITFDYKWIDVNGNYVDGMVTLYRVNGDTVAIEFADVNTGINRTAYYKITNYPTILMHDLQDDGSWNIEEQDLQILLMYGLLDYYNMSSLIASDFIVGNDGYFRPTNPILAFANLFGYNEEYIGKVTDFRVKVVNQKIVKIMAVAYFTNYQEYLAVDLTFDEYGNAVVNLPNVLDIEYGKLIGEKENGTQYQAQYIITKDGVIENVTVRYSNGLYHFVVKRSGEEFEVYYDANENSGYMKIYGNWAKFDNIYDLPTDLYVTLLSLPKSFHNGVIAKNYILSEMVDLTDNNKYIVKNEFLNYLGSLFFQNGFCFNDENIALSNNFTNVTFELINESFGQVEFLIDGYSIVATYSDLEGEVVLPIGGGENPDPGTEFNEEDLDMPVSGLLTNALNTIGNNYTITFINEDEYAKIKTIYKFVDNQLYVDSENYGEYFIIFGDEVIIYETDMHGNWSVSTKTLSFLYMTVLLSLDLSLFSEDSFVMGEKYWDANDEVKLQFKQAFQFTYDTFSTVQFGTIEGILAIIKMVGEYATYTCYFSQIGTTTIEAPQV